jgi:hypothetical protein
MTKLEKNNIFAWFSRDIRIFSLILLSGMFWGFSVQAVNLGLSISPQVFELDAYPGEKITQKINLGNKSEVALPIVVRLVDFTAEEDSGEMLFDESLQDPSIASRKWFEIKNSNLLLGPGEEKEINFTISVPGNAEPGGHNVVMFFEPQLPSYYFQPGQPRAIPVIGALFLISVKMLSLEQPDPSISPGQVKLEITEFSLPKEERMAGVENFVKTLTAGVVQAADINIIDKPPQKFILRIKNNDIYHIKPFGKIVIYNIFGKKAGETEIPRQTILAGRTRQFPVEFSPETPKIFKWLPASISGFLANNFFFGKYSAKIELQAKSPLSAEILQTNLSVVLTIFSLPWKFWLGFILIFGLLAFLIIKYRKRIVGFRKRIIFAAKAVFKSQ